MAAMAGDCSQGDEGLINITVDREAKTVKISDNGIGMTADGVKFPSVNGRKSKGRKSATPPSL